MDSNHKPYDFLASFGRLDEILNQADVNYQEKDSLPDRDLLTFSNGFYANCSALFVDIRGSSELPTKYRRPALARLYRAYISEMVAVMNGDPKCREINIVGDGVWCVVNTPYKRDIDRVFQTGYTAASLVKTLNCKIEKRGFDPIKVGIGMDWGRALMIKAGLAGSGLNDVVYMGEVVNRAAKLASKGNASLFARPMMIGSNFAGNLKDENRSMLSWDSTNQCYAADVVNSAMEEWHRQNCT